MFDLAYSYIIKDRTCNVYLHLIFQGWEKDQNRRGLELLETVNISLRVEDFDPYKSQVTLSLEPTAGEWNSLIDTKKVYAVILKWDHVKT